MFLHKVPMARCMSFASGLRFLAGKLPRIGQKVTLRSSSTSVAWRFVNWTDNDGTVVSTQSTFTYIDINANKTLTANYVAQQVSQVTLSHAPSMGNFKPTLNGAGTYVVGTKINVSAPNKSDWTLVGQLTLAGETGSASGDASLLPVGMLLRFPQE